MPTFAVPFSILFCGCGRRPCAAIATLVLTCSLAGCLKAPDGASSIPDMPIAQVAFDDSNDGSNDPAMAETGGQVRPDNSPPRARSSALQPPYAKRLAQFNRGAALMEQYEYAKAGRVFIQLLEAEPNWLAARFNLGLAYYNMITETNPKKRLGSSDEMIAGATRCLDEILKKDPGNLHAHYLMGMLKVHLGETEKALGHFHQVYKKDPNDRFTAFSYAQVLYKLRRFDEAIPILERIVQHDRGFGSAFHYLLLAYSRTKRRAEAIALQDRFRKLQKEELAVGTFMVDVKYGTAGKYTFVFDAAGLPLPPPRKQPARRIVFAPQPAKLPCNVTNWNCDAGKIALPAIAVADIDQDQDLDLLLATENAPGHAQLFINDGSGTFSPGRVIADKVVSASFGDINNDGHIDIWLGRAAQDLALLGNGKGQFTTAPFQAIAGPDALTAIATLADIDSDGDLDLLAMRRQAGDVPTVGKSEPTASSVWFNNADGSFVDKAKAIGLQLEKSVIAAIVYDDFDNDFDLDLMAFPAEGLPIAWVNFRAGEHRLLAAERTGLQASGTLSAVSGDPNKDGNRDLLVFTREGMRLFLNDGHFHFREDERFARKLGKLGGTGGQFADFDNDGDLDILLADARRDDGTRGPALLVNNWPAIDFDDAGTLDPGLLLNAVETNGDASVVAADFTGDGRCDILLAPANQSPMLIANNTVGGNWIELELSGKRPEDNLARSANSAIGARVEVRTGTLYQQFVLGGNSGPVASQPLRIHVGLGDHAKVDWLRILWPDAILQGEVEIPGNQLHLIAEQSRKPSSCPFLFAWTGSHYEFVADFGGVGGLGYFLGNGQYAHPDPTEYLPLPQLVPLNGHYVLQAMTPLEEITYFDEVKLLAIDHPPGTEVFPHEMMAISVAPPEFELFAIRKRLHATTAVDHDGRDVADRLRKTDRQYAGATSVDSRFVGLAKPHFVDLDFGNPIGTLGADQRLILFLRGWVEYGYSSTNYAASQANQRTQAPTISVLRDGKWIELCHEIGYPAGLNHLMTVDLTSKIQPADQILRISSNMELYWDEVFLGIHDPEIKLTVHEVAAKEADLHFRGYPRAYSPDGRHPPLYDYHSIDRNVGWKLMAGDYTRFGDVRPLLAKPDDCFVIMGHGEEITLRFAERDFPSLENGRTRSFVLKTDSYCKDMDLYTAYPDTVEPLPFHAMSGYPYGSDEHYPDTEKTRKYRETWNTRRIENR